MMYYVYYALKLLCQIICRTTWLKDSFDPSFADSRLTFVVTMVVILSNELSNCKHPVDSSLSKTDSAIPPVKSLRPSSVVPYFNASYEPCNLRTIKT